jgi:tetratricopeptide (TPR) repeat protein
MLLYFRESRWDQAIAVQRRIVALMEETEPRSYGTAVQRANLAWFLGLGDYCGAAMPLFGQALSKIKQARKSRDTVLILGHRGWCLSALGEQNKAETDLRRALARLQMWPPGPIQDEAKGLTLNNLAIVMRRQKRFDVAERIYAELLERCHTDQDSRRTAECANRYRNRGILSLSQWNLVEAEPYLREALEIYTDTLGPRHRDTEEARCLLEFVLQCKGDAEGAAALGCRTHRRHACAPEESDDPM